MAKNRNGGYGRPRQFHDEFHRKARAWSIARKARLRPIHQKLIADFLDKPCVDCGQQFPPPAMQPDHIRPKKYKVSWYKDGNGSTKMLLEELQKCEVRCANCHVIRHSKE